MKASFSASRTRVFTLIACIGVFAINSFAQFISMTHTGVGSGTIGGTPFANKTFTITDVASTASRVSFGGGYTIVDLSASISIAEVGTFQFTSGTRTFVKIGRAHV